MFRKVSIFLLVDFITFTKHACAGSSKLKATTAGHIYNILIEQDLDNGSVVAKGDYVKPEVYKAKIRFMLHSSCIFLINHRNLQQ